MRAETRRLLSEAAKASFASGRINPMKGVKRTDLSDRIKSSLAKETRWRLIRIKTCTMGAFHAR